MVMHGRGFGLAEEIIEENFSSYRKKHAIPFE